MRVGVLSKMTDELTHKLDAARRLIQLAAEAAEKERGRLEVAYSGGKDSDLLLFLARQTLAGKESILHPVYHCTTIDPPFTTAHCVANGVEVMMPEVPLLRMIEKKGLPSRWSRWCCELYKEQRPVERRVLLGIRRAEGVKRAKRYREPEECRVKKGMKVRQYYPLLFLTNKEVEEAISYYGIKCHPLYYDEQGTFHVERRLGCIACPQKTIEKRISDFRQFPRLFLALAKAVRRYRETHKRGKVAKKYKDEWQTIACNLYGEDVVNNVLFETDWKTELKRIIGI